MKWNEITSSERDTLIHTKVMEKKTTCGGAIVPPNGDTWGVTAYYCQQCGRVMIGKPPEICDRILPVPAYTTSLDAAWLVVRRMNNPNNPVYPDYQDYARFIDELGKIVGSDMLFDLFYCDHEGDHLTPERICLAALRALDIEI